MANAAAPPDLQDRAYLADKRDAEPVFWDTAHRGWAVTRYEDVARCLDNDGTWLASNFYDWHLLGIPKASRSEFKELLSLPGHVLTEQDGPYHSLLKEAIARPLNRQVKRAAGDIDRIVAEALNELPEAFDLAKDFANPVAEKVICAVLGIRETQRARVVESASQILCFLAFEPRATPAVLLERARAAKAALATLSLFFEEQLLMRTRAPRDDLMSELVNGDPPQGRVGTSAGEAAYLALTVLIAGFVTTGSFLSLAMVRLLGDRSAYRAVAEDPGQLSRTCETLFRLDGPTVFVVRRAIAEFTLHDKTIRPGQLVLLHLDSANRDEARFGQKAELAPATPTPAHLALDDAHPAQPLAAFSVLRSVQSLPVVSRRAAGPNT